MKKLDLQFIKWDNLEVLMNLSFTNYLRMSLNVNLIHSKQMNINIIVALNELIFCCNDSS